MLRYSPPLAVRKTTADYLREAGIPAGEAIATWQRHGSVYGTPAARKKSAPDPYQVIREAFVSKRKLPGPEEALGAAGSFWELSINSGAQPRNWKPQARC